MKYITGVQLQCYMVGGINNNKKRKKETKPKNTKENINRKNKKLSKIKYK